MKLSIITVNLNNIEGLQKTFESVFNQTYAGFEFLVIDGGSTDGSCELIEKDSDKLNFWVSEPDNGIYNAMNKGIKYANGEYCLFLNSGDSLVHENILSEIFEHGFKEDILYGNLQVVKNGKFIGLATTPAEITFKTLFEETIHHQAAFIKRELFNVYGFYNEEYRIRADWEFWIRTIILNNCTSRYLDRIISIYDAEGFSSSPHTIEVSKLETKKILELALPEKVITDYEAFVHFHKEMQIMKWAKRKRLLYSFINLIYSIASYLFKIKKDKASSSN